MAKITSLIEFKGSAGNMTGYKGRDGKYVLRKRTWDRKNARSVLQMRRRVAWANMVAVWKVLAQYMEPSFASKTIGQTDFNAFMQVNTGTNNVFLTSQEKRVGAAIVAPYMITEGSLPAINLTTVSGGRMRTDIAIGELEVDDTISTAAFSRAIVNNNAGWQFGDQLTIVVLEQVTEGVTQTPRIRANVKKVVLDSSDNTPITDYLDAAYVANNEGFIATSSTINGGLGYIQSRAEDGKTLVSTTRLTVNNSMLENYTDASSQADAIKSYGGANVKYLTPTGTKYLAGAGE